jgi:hypothetical protein
LGDYGLHASDQVAATAALIKAAYGPIKAVAPDVQVLAGALAYSDGDFLQKLYDDGIHGYFDGLSIHPYNAWDPNDASVPEARPWTYLTGVPWIQSILAAHGDGDKGLWLTELGWSSCLPGGTDAWCVSDAQQAQYVGDALRIAAGWPYVKAVVIYGLRNTGSDPNDRESQFGLVNQDFTLKPAYAAFQRALIGPLPSQGEAGTGGAAATPDTTTSPADTTTSATPAQKPATPDLGTPPVTLPPEAAPSPFAVAVSPGRAARGRTVPVKIRCTPAAAKRCRGRLELRSPAKTLLASGTFDVARGVATAHAKLTKAGRAALARRRPPRLVATVTANGMEILRATVR